MQKKYSFISIALSSALLSGCGAIQTVADASVSISKAVFTTQINVLKIDLSARDELNTGRTDDIHTVVVRIYQLKNRETFDKTDIETLWNKDKEILKQDLVAMSESIISPNSQKSLNHNMHKETNFVAIVAFYEQTPTNGEWKIVTPRRLISSNEPLKFELVKNNLRELPDKNINP